MRKPIDWAKQAVIAAYVIGVPALGLAIIAYLWPQDPAHPTRFDFLSRTFTTPLWLAALSVGAVVVITEEVTRLVIRRTRISSAHAPSPPIRAQSQNEFVVTGITANDPRLSISLQDVKEGGLSFKQGVVIKNVGGSEAHNLRLANVTASKHTITFPENISVLDAGESTRLMAPRVKDFGPLQMHDMARAMIDAWENQPEPLAEVIRFPALATYKDYMGNGFRATWEYELHTFKYMAATRREDRGGNEFLPNSQGPYITVSSIKTERIGGDKEYA
jgi:hypothetical protein